MLNYKKAGVDIDKADRFVNAISRLASKTMRQEIIAGIGGFSALSKIPSKYKNPVLVSSTDGVGTKLLLAQYLNRHTSVGIDLVAMCVNDVIVMGAEPLFFLDYFAVGKLDNKTAKDVIKGIVEGCRLSGCALIGGETAEMPGMYKKDEYDLAGFCVGIVEKEQIIDGSSVKPGDRIIGIESSGLHSNGFSLVRKVFTKDELKTKFGKLLLTPTIIYVKMILKLIEKINIKSIAHITGGGFYDNIPRVLPAGAGALIEKESWRVPNIFNIIKKRAKLNDREMFRTFNMGIGMIVVVSRRDAGKTQEVIKRCGLKSWAIGEIIKGERTGII